MTAAHPIVLGTAGHIDHGKTSLVRALTGIDTDRLPVEKARGITTELGFARLDLGDRRIAVVDVPGHERFVKSMVAGATGLDLVMLVVAADEGVMPQTREHLDICQLLGVRRGLIVVTKRDLVDDDWLALVEAELRATVAGTFLADAPIVPCSTRTGAGPGAGAGSGMDALRAQLAATIDALPP
ncbi:MAG TPA: GTP-binding protein, partial [Kofleriaceae bacterium]